MKLNIKKLDPRAILPTYATDGSACFDLYALDIVLHLSDMTGIRRVYRTGLAMDVPQGHAMLIFSRSGHAFQNDVRLANCVGVIDSDYRGELLVKLTSDATLRPLTIVPGTRIAQAMVVPVERVEWVEVAELSETARGEGGFGSTGL